MAAASTDENQGSADSPVAEGVTGVTGTEPVDRLRSVVPTGAIFCAAIERLNRESHLRLLEELIEEVDQHFQLLTERAQGAAIPSSSERVARLAPIIEAVTTQLEAKLGELLDEKLRSLSAQLLRGNHAQVVTKPLPRSRPQPRGTTLQRLLLSVGIVVLCFLFGLLLSKQAVVALRPARSGTPPILSPALPPTLPPTPASQSAATPGSRSAATLPCCQPCADSAKSDRAP
jgi:hypothetical protein